MKLTIIFIFIVISACESDNHDKHKSSLTEGNIIDSGKYEFAKTDDKTSILHPERIKKLGLDITWSVRLQNKRKIRKFHLLNESVIIETEDNQIHSLNRENGQYKWMIQINEKLDFAPYMYLAEDGKKMLFLIARNHLYCIDTTVTYAGREIGRILWVRNLDHTASTAPHANDFDVIIGSENNFVMSYNYKRVGQVLNDTQLDRPNHYTWHRSLPDRITSAPTSNRDPNNPVTMVGCHDGRIYGFNFSTGKTMWKFPSNTSVGGEFKADLLHHSDKAYAPNMNHTLYILDGSSGREDGKITLQSPLSKTPWVLGDVKYKVIKDGSKVEITQNDLDIFIQADGDYINKDGHFYRIIIENIVVRKIIDPNTLSQLQLDPDEENDTVDDARKRYFRRWVAKISWQLEGKYDLLFRTKNFVFLKKENKIVKVNRITGQIIYKHELGETAITIYPDSTSDYLKSRLFVATDRDIYAIGLKK